jgi:hypothetical protein
MAVSKGTVNQNDSAGIEIYKLPPTLTKETFERTEGPFRSGITKKYSNKRSGEKLRSSRRELWLNRGSPVFTFLVFSVIWLKCRLPRIGLWISKNSKRSESKPERPAIRVARRPGPICEPWQSQAAQNWFCLMEKRSMDRWRRTLAGKIAVLKTTGRSVLLEDTASTRSSLQRRQ